MEIYQCSKKLATNDRVDLTFRHIQYLHLINTEIAWVLVSSGTQVQSQIILDPDYLLDYLSVSYDHVFMQYCGFSENHNLGP